MVRWLLVMAIGVVPRAGHASTAAEWKKALPGMCVGVDIETGYTGDAEAESAMVRAAMAELDKLDLERPLEARLARFKHPALSSETAACDAQDDRWSAPITLDTVAAMTGTVPSGVSHWGVTVKLRLAQPADDLQRMKISADFVIAQFRGAPLPDIDPSITIARLKGWGWADPPLRLFVALGAVAKDRKAAKGAPIFDALAAVLDDKPLPASAAELPPKLLIALWSPRDQLAAWVPRLDERGWFADEVKSDLVARYFGKLPPLPGTRWRSRPRDDDLLRDLMKMHVAVDGEDKLIEDVWSTWRARKEYDGYKNVIRVLEQLTFAQRRITVADKLFVATAKLDPPPAGYRRDGLVLRVFELLWRMKQPLDDATVAALVDEAVKLGPSVTPAARSSLENVTWPVKNRDALLMRLGAK